MNFNIFQFFDESLYLFSITLSSIIFSFFILKVKKWYIPLLFLILSFGVGASFYFVLLYFQDGKNTAIPYLINVINVSWYASIILFAFLIIYLSFNGDKTKKMFCLTIGFLYSSFLFGIFRLFYDFGLIYLREFNLLYYMIHLLVCLIGNLILFLILKFYIFKKSYNFVISKKIIIFLFIAIVFDLFLRFAMQAVYETIKDNKSISWISNITISIISLLFIFLIQYLNKNNNEKEEKELLKIALLKQNEQYEISKKSIEMINQKCHDIKHSLKSLEALDKSIQDEVLKDLDNNLSIYDSRIDTSNSALNVLLQEKSFYCLSNDIKFSSLIDGKYLNFIKLVDIYALFSNLIDNAIDATIKLDNKDKRIINIVGYKQNNFYIIRCDNYYNIKDLKVENNEIKTSNDDKLNHGFGIKSIKYIVSSYGGNVTFDPKDDIFTVIITFPLKEE